MEMTGEQRVAASRDEVWAALNDPEVLKACVPGCETIEKQSESDYRIVMLAVVGPIKARFNGKLAIKDADPPQGYALVFEGSGGAAGFGKGQATVALMEEASDATLLRYTVSAQVSGKLAQVGSRLIDGVAKKMAGDFFARFNARFAAEPPADGAAAAGPAAAQAQAARAMTGSGPAAVSPPPDPAVAPAARAAAEAPSAAVSGASSATGWKIATFVFAAIAAAALAYAASIG